jgi:hypothetical protein
MASSFARRFSLIEPRTLDLADTSAELRNEIYSYCIEITEYPPRDFDDDDSPRFMQLGRKQLACEEFLPDLYLQPSRTRADYLRLGGSKAHSLAYHARMYHGLTQVCSAIGNEFLPLYQGQMNVNIWLPDLPAYLERFL